jgi:hypothetical protein
MFTLFRLIKFGVKLTYKAAMVFLVLFLFTSMVRGAAPDPGSSFGVILQDAQKQYLLIHAASPEVEKIIINDPNPVLVNSVGHREPLKYLGTGVIRINLLEGGFTCHIFSFDERMRVWTPLGGQVNTWVEAEFDTPEGTKFAVRFKTVTSEPIL